jgi:L-ascorbate metabolism protein UlaG (beta-lactamase superfamily)
MVAGVVATSDDRAARDEPVGAGGVVAYLGHATTVIELGGTQVLTDPVLTSGVTFIRRVTSPPVHPLEETALVLISHGHHDHLHQPSLGRVGLDVPVVVPVGLGGLVGGWGHRAVTELPLGSSIEVGAVRVTAVHADHSGARPPIGPKSTAIGFILEGGGRTAYFAGDTALYPEMADLGMLGLDVAFVPIWGWGPRLGPGHLDPDGAAEALTLLRPRIAIPIHWGTLWPFGMRWRRERLVDPPARFVEAAANIAPGTRVVVLSPGESMELDEVA